MAKSKNLTQDQLDHLDTFCNDFISAGEDLKTYLDEVISKRNDGYSIVAALKEKISEVQIKVSKLSDVAESNKWDLLIDDDEEIEIDFSDEDDE